MKSMRPGFLIAAVLLPVFTAVTSECARSTFTPADSAYYWFTCCQTPEGPVISEGTDSFSVEDQALAALVFLVRGHYHRAEKILAFFERLQRRNKVNFKGFYSSYQLNGEPLSSELRAGTQLWLVNAAAWYTTCTGDKSYLRFGRELAKHVIELEGPEGGVSAGYVGADPIAYITASDNILAASVFSNLWSATQSSEYRFAAYRSWQFLNIFLRDEDTGNFFLNNIGRKAEAGDTAVGRLAALVLDAPEEGLRHTAAQDDFSDRSKVSLLYSLAGKKDSASMVLGEVASGLQPSREHPGGAALPYRRGGPGYDIANTAWYLFAAEGFSPFKKYPPDWKDTDHYFQTFKKYSGENFEDGEMKMLLVWGVKDEQGFANKPRLDWFKDKEKEATGSGVMRIFLPAKPEKEPARLVVGRQFIEPQDFSPVRSVNYYCRAVPGLGSSVISLKMALGVIDGDGERWMSKENMFITRVKYVFKVGFPTEWERQAGVKGNGVLDADKIRELTFIITQDSDNPWDIYFDDISLQ
jgi:hypothetical protein